MAFNLSSLTKKSDAQPVVAPVWHPNFRNFERLPDTKVVRTTFFINTAAVAITISLLLWLGYREMHIRGLNEQIVDSQKQIDANLKQSNDAIRLTKVFNDEQKKLAEAADFIGGPITPMELVLTLAKTLPKEIALESFDLRLSTTPPPQCVLRGVVAGTADQATGVVSDYIEQLRGQPQIGGIFDSISLTNLDRDAGRGVMVFEIMLKAKTGKKEKNP
jgi:hypothetical protein